MWVCENLHQIRRENKIEECGSKTLENRRIKKLKKLKIKKIKKKMAGERLELR